MAKAATSATLNTTLVVGQVEVAIGLFSAVAKPGSLTEFQTAGPNGGVLVARPVARPVAVADVSTDEPDAPATSDPLADDGQGAIMADSVAPTHMFAGAAVHDSLERYAQSKVDASEPVVAPAVEGEYGRELVEEGTGEIVAPDQVRRGVRLEDGRFIDCTEHLAGITERTRIERVEVLGFVDVTHVPRARVKGAQYIGAANEVAPRALRLLFEALKLRRRGALVKLTKRSRQTLGVIAPRGKVLMLCELVFAEDFREPPARALAIADAEVSDAMVERMCHLVDALSVGPYVLDSLRDDAVWLREELYARALQGDVESLESPAPRVDPELEAMLAASLAVVGS